jgi:hypothetical protein
MLCYAIQVHANGIRVIASGRAPQEWRTPGKKVCIVYILYYIITSLR